MLIFKYIPNLLKDEGRIIKELPFVANKTIQEYVVETGFSLEDSKVIVTGVIAKDLNSTLKDGDEVIVTPNVNIPALIFIGSWLWAYAGVIFTVLSIAYSIYSMCVKPKTPTYNTSGDGLDEGSPTYGWDGIVNTQSVGVPVGVVYGEHRVGGNIINQYIRTDGDKEYLNLLIALSEGEIDSIDSIEINENPADNFDDIVVTKRYGTNSQAQITSFNDSHDLRNLSVNLTKNNSYVYTTSNSDITAFELHLTLVGGLFQSNNSGISSWAVTYQVEYKLHSSPTYIDLGSTTIDGKSRTDLRRVYRKDNLDSGKYDVRITRTSDDSQLDPLLQGDLYLKGVDEIAQDEPLIYPNVALLGIEALATDQLNGSTPTVTSLVRGRKVSIPDVRESLGGSAVIWDDYYWNPNSGGSFRLLDGDDELYWDGSTYVNAFSANPIWCLRDLLTNTRYGLGDYIAIANMNITQLLEMAKYCEEKVSDGDGGYEKRFRLDVVIDSATKALDLVSQLSATFRCFTFYSNGEVKLKIDKAESPVQMFGMGNIVEESFLQSWKSIKEIPNVIEVQFMNKDLNYKQDIISVMDEASITAGDPIRKKNLRLFCTRISQAIREGNYALNIGKAIQRTVTLKAGIDAIACQTGDVINVSHDIPQWGFSGRVLSGSTNVTNGTIVLDQSVTIVGGKTYQVMCRHADDTIETKTVTDGVGTYTTLHISGTWTSVPVAFDIYSFGEVGKVVAPYRIVSMKRAENSEVEITALEYDSDVYDTDTITIPDNNYSALTTAILSVSNLALTEGVSIQPDGTVKSTIEVWFNKPDDTESLNKFESAKIYFSDNTGASYELVGDTTGNTFVINRDFILTQTYLVKVVTVMTNGVEQGLTGAPSASITIAGRTVKPSNVSGFAYTWGDLLLLTWDAVTDVDLAEYEIRDEDDNWGTDDSHLIYRGLALRKTLQPSARTVGDYYIKAKNRSGQYSTTAGTVTPTNATPSAPASITANVVWDTATISWADLSDADVKYYEVLKSETNAWAGEEAVVARVSGKSYNIKAKYSRSGQVDSATNNTVIDDSLIGLGDDYCNGDTIEITSGTGVGQSKTITDFVDATGTITVDSVWTTIPDSTSKYMIYDKCYVKVRGVDTYGVGTLSSAVTVEFTTLDENAFGDAVITARKIYVACLSALSANMGCLTAGLIQGGTIQTGATGARTVFSGTEFRTYDASDCVMFEVNNGCVMSRTLKLVDYDCDCCYSYLSAGQWYFHDELGNQTPYVKRLCTGEAVTGCTIDLCGWRSEPKIQVGIKTLASYNSDYAVNCQLWCVYYDAMCQYCLCAECYGYCFIAHAKLVKSAGAYGECIQDVAEGCSIFTHADAICTLIRSKFGYWCFCNTSSTNYGYGIHCYRLKYKCCTAGCAWTCCDYAYCQPHSTSGELTDCYYVCQTLYFPKVGCWEIQLNNICTTWCATTISGLAYCCCCRTYDATNFYASASISKGDTYPAAYCNNTCTISTAVSFAGSKPINVYCSYICFTWLSISPNLHAQGSRVYNSNDQAQASALLCIYGITLAYANLYLEGAGSINCNWGGTSCCVDLTSCNACSFANFCAVDFAGAWVSDYGVASASAYSCFGVCTGYLIQCYCALASNATCCFAHLYGVKDYSACETVLDPSGVLSYLAIGYS